LQLAGEALAGLHPRSNEGPEAWRATEEDQLETVHSKTDQFYALLNVCSLLRILVMLIRAQDIQISLRASARKLRSNKASPLPLLYQPASTSSVASGSRLTEVSSGNDLQLGLNATRIHAAAWLDLKASLEQLASD
jgi:hypothetical protein